MQITRPSVILQCILLWNCRHGFGTDFVFINKTHFFPCGCAIKSQGKAVSDSGSGSLLQTAQIWANAGVCSASCVDTLSSMVVCYSLFVLQAIYVIGCREGEVRDCGLKSYMPMVGTLHSARGAMVDLSHESGPKSEASVAVQNVERSRTSKVSGSCQKVSGSWRRLARLYATSSSPERRSTYAYARRTGVTSGDLR